MRCTRGSPLQSCNDLFCPRGKKSVIDIIVSPCTNPPPSIWKCVLRKYNDTLLGDIKSSARAHVDSLMLNACSGLARKAYCLQMCQICQIQYLHWATVTINTRNITDYSHHIYFHTWHMWLYLVCVWGVSWGEGEFCQLCCQFTSCDGQDPKNRPATLFNRPGVAGAVL